VNIFGGVSDLVEGMSAMLLVGGAWSTWRERTGGTSGEFAGADLGIVMTKVQYLTTPAKHSFMPAEVVVRTVSGLLDLVILDIGMSFNSAS